jgi:hypothetical protein
VNAFELTPKEAFEQVVAFLDYERINYERAAPGEGNGHIGAAVLVLKQATTKTAWKQGAGYADYTRLLWEPHDPIGLWGSRQRDHRALHKEIREARFEAAKITAALKHVIAHLQYQQEAYERLSAEVRKGHVWEAVAVLKREIGPSWEVKLLERINKAQSAVKKIEGPIQGY